MSEIVKRSISIQGHRTSISLEQAFFDALVEIAASRSLSLAQLVAEIDETRPRQSNLSSALRVYVLNWFRNRG